MKTTKKIFTVLFIMLLTATSVQANILHININCDNGKTITNALKFALPGTTIKVTGTCKESVTIKRNGLTIDGQGSATIDGEGQDVVTIDGAQRVTIKGITIENGNRGVVGKSNASFTIINTTVTGNTNTGIRVEGSSSLTTAGTCTTSNNGFNGIEIDRASEMTISDNLTIQNNALFGIFINSNSSVTCTKANVAVNSNILGIQVGAKSSVFISDSDTTVNTSNNNTTGLTVVSGSTLFVFGGKIISKNNSLNHGVSANSNSNIDLDRGGSIKANNNGMDGIKLENSLLNMFNMQGFPGSKVDAHNNGQHGISASLGSVIDLSDDSTLDISDNVDIGLSVDNDSTAHILNSNISGGFVLTFGSRADLQDNTIDNIRCDGTVLIRGNTSCP